MLFEVFIINVVFLINFFIFFNFNLYYEICRGKSYDDNGVCME